MNGFVEITSFKDSVPRYAYNGTIPEEVCKIIPTLPFLCDEDKAKLIAQYLKDKELRDATQELEDYLHS